MKKPISLDLRERIVAAYVGNGMREEVAKRFKMSVGMVKKLLAREPDVTLAEIKQRLGSDCTTVPVAVGQNEPY